MLFRLLISYHGGEEEDEHEGIAVMGPTISESGLGTVTVM